MIEEHARVIDVDDDCVTLVVDRQSACGKCASGSGCGTALLAAWFNRRQIRFSLPNEVGAGVGDRVVLGIDERLIQRGALLMYAVPLVALLSAAVGGRHLAPLAGLSPELGSIVLGLSAAAAALYWTNRRGTARTTHRDLGMRVLRIVGKTDWGGNARFALRAQNPGRET